MDIEPNFSRAERPSSSERDRVAKCREMAAHSARLAGTGNDELRELFSDLAACWSELANVEERN